MIDARVQTGTAPDEQTEMRYPTRASELVNRRLQVPPSLPRDPARNPTSRQYAGREIIVRVMLDLGHQSHVSALLVQPFFTTASPDVLREVGPDQLHGLDTRDPKNRLDARPINIMASLIICRSTRCHRRSP